MTGNPLIWALTLICAVCADFPCEQYGVDISDGEAAANGSVTKDGVVYEPENVVSVENKTLGCVCNLRPCLRKCCPWGRFLLNRTCEETAARLWFPEMANFQLVVGSDCAPGKRRTLHDLRDRQGQHYTLEADGVVLMHFGAQRVRPEDYCVDLIEDEEDLRALVCVVEKSSVTPSNTVGMIISMPFLLATFIVYALLPDKNLHAKCLMCYVINLFGAYIFLVTAQLGVNVIDGPFCIVIGILCFFFFMVSFFFMNVMSIDIWWTFSGFRGFSGSRRENEFKKFLLYGAYAWGTPVIMVAIVTSLVLGDFDMDRLYHPGIGYGQCWFVRGLPELIYFHGPVSVLIIANVFFFAMTAIKIKKVQRDTAVLQMNDSRKHNYESDKQNFNLYLKLMLAMGINWTMEIVSWAVNWQFDKIPTSLWYVTDFLNAIYGVFIFFIFVFKRKVWMLLKKRYEWMTQKNQSTRTLTLEDYSNRVNNDVKGNGDDKRISVTSATMTTVT